MSVGTKLWLVAAALLGLSALLAVFEQQTPNASGLRAFFIMVGTISALGGIGATAAAILSWLGVVRL